MAQEGVRGTQYYRIQHSLARRLFDPYLTRLKHILCGLIIILSALLHVASSYRETSSLVVVSDDDVVGSDSFMKPTREKCNDPS
jgi:hypothetical protein